MKRQNQSDIPSTPLSTKKQQTGNMHNGDQTGFEALRDQLKQLPRKNDPLVLCMQMMLQMMEKQQQLIDLLMEKHINAESQSQKAENDENPAEAKERARSIVIAGLPEAVGKPSARATADKEKLVNLFDELDVETEVVSTFRMGTVRDNRPRLLKVVLANTKQQKTVIMNAKKLKSSDDHKGVFIRPSLTKAERDEDYALRRELRECRAKGERIRIKGWPGEKREIVELSAQENL